MVYIARRCRSRSASTSPEIGEYLDARGLSLTDVLHEWYDLEIGVHGSSRLKQELAELEALEATIPMRRAALEKSVVLAEQREDRMAKLRKERDERVRRRRSVQAVRD